MKEKLEKKLNGIKIKLAEYARDQQTLDLNKYYAEGQKIALQDALDYLKEEVKEKQNA